MTDPVVPLQGVLYPHQVPKVGPADHGTGRRCASCGCKVGRYTAPQPITLLPLCNQCWSVPAGYTLSATGRCVVDRIAA